MERTAELTDEFEIIEEYEGINEQQADESFRRLLKRGVPEFIDQMQLSVSKTNIYSPHPLTYILPQTSPCSDINVFTLLFC